MPVAAPRCSVIVCAYNEEQALGECLRSLVNQTRPADEILVVDNASTDSTPSVAASVPGVIVVSEPRRGLVFARVAGQRASTGDVIAYMDADCRAPAEWLARIEATLMSAPDVAAVTSGYRFYDWDIVGRTLIRLYDWIVAPLTHVFVQHVFHVGAILYGGNFAVRRTALEAVGGFDTSIEFHGEDANLGRRLIRAGRVRLVLDAYVYTSARRYKAMGRFKVFRLYVRNFWSEVLMHRPKDVSHEDIRR